MCVQTSWRVMSTIHNDDGTYKYLTEVPIGTTNRATLECIYFIKCLLVMPLQNLWGHCLIYTSHYTPDNMQLSEKPEFDNLSSVLSFKSDLSNFKDNGDAVILL